MCIYRAATQFCANEFNSAKNSGLLAETTNLDRAGNIHIAVYEDGQLVAEDSDWNYAQISY